MKTTTNKKVLEISQTWAQKRSAQSSAGEKTQVFVVFYRHKLLDKQAVDVHIAKKNEILEK